jgi:putative PIN family toxin of toxin-antitoxin system
MIRAVLDTNIIVSALITKKLSPPEIIFRAFIAQRFILVTSGLILNEVEEVLNRGYLAEVHGWKPAQVRSRVETMAQLSLVVPDAPLLEPASLDPDDDMFLAAALLGRVQYVVSGDKKHLLNMGSYQGIPIITARQFVTEVLDAGI